MPKVVFSIGREIGKKRDGLSSGLVHGAISGDGSRLRMHGGREGLRGLGTPPPLSPGGVPGQWRSSHFPAVSDTPATACGLTWPARLEIASSFRRTRGASDSSGRSRGVKDGRRESPASPLPRPSTPAPPGRVSVAVWQRGSPLPRLRRRGEETSCAGGWRAVRQNCDGKLRRIARRRRRTR